MLRKARQQRRAGLTAQLADEIAAIDARVGSTMLDGLTQDLLAGF